MNGRKCAVIYDSLRDYQKAHDSFTAAYNANPDLVKTTATKEWLEYYIKKYPEFYEKTFEPLLTEEQKKSAEMVKLEIQKSDRKKEKFQAFKARFHLFSHSDNQVKQNQREKDQILKIIFY